MHGLTEHVVSMVFFFCLLPQEWVRSSEKPMKYTRELFMPTEITLSLVCNSLLTFSIEEGKASTGREHELRDSGCSGVKPGHTLQW